ncbi:MAG: DUF6261 family protein [Bacteroidales bacterium]|nr:DUF6261 family protein [Bacteroidales bacterium]
MEIAMQIDQISIARATNAAHYEYLTTVRKRTEEIRLENELWQRAVEEFREAFEKEDKAFKQYRASDHTSALQKADEERDKLYASLRDTIKAYAKFPIAETAQHAEPLLKVIKNYKITTRENYMKESGLIDNMLQDLLQYERQLNRLGLLIVANQLKAKNDEVRQLIAQRNEERIEQVLGELKAARAVSDVAYAAVVMFTNAYALLNPDRREAADLVKRMQEDLEYFRRHAMPDPHRTRDAAPDDEEPEQPVEPAE